VLCCTVVLGVSAVAQTVEPWKWTREQRLAARFDANARAARIAEARSENARRGRTSAAVFGRSDSPGDVIDGKSHPELFLPTELFENLVEWRVKNDEFRLAWQQQADDILRTDDDWREFDKRVAPYAANLREEHELLEQEGRSSAPQRRQIEQHLLSIRASRCALTAAALRSVRAYFGKEKFDRFMYSIVARSMATTYAAQNPFDDTRAMLLAKEACQ
jgi:hypothetical protein